MCGSPWNAQAVRRGQRCVVAAGGSIDAADPVTVRGGRRGAAMARGGASGSHHGAGAGLENWLRLSQRRQPRWSRWRRAETSRCWRRRTKHRVSAKKKTVSAMYLRWRAHGLVTGPLNGLRNLNRAEIFGRFRFISGWTELGEFR
jgi:hypothetical protein